MEGGPGDLRQLARESFGDETVAAALIDRLVHHAEVHSLKAESYRMRGRELGRTPTTNND
ncbi:ATP-binding protein [Kitasatospora sp. NBC_00240]|uniref:ATP-binding protein n=1 Tax=Kitasatospora sp. NBC_00240 TaxID=2903567 RepID=UPI002B1DFAD0|nr:ATP-binding protein [Kitasatospora sp. NBC_00240]